MKKLRIGLFGFGVVGEGIYQVLQKTEKLNTEVLQVVIKDASKPRNAPTELFSLDKSSILENADIDVVVELIDEPLEAYAICKEALVKGKDVVTANKKMVADHLPELIALQNQYGGSLLYEAAVCGSIPIIRNLEDAYENDELESLSGIVNGSTNYILSNMTETGENYSKVLQKAQDLGFAESDPSLDVSGADAANKLSILLYHAYGNRVGPSKIATRGIENIHPFDIDYGRRIGSQIKLIANSYWTENGSLVAHVIPQFVAQSDQLFHVKNEYNAVNIGSSLADEQLLYGKGAGRYPTSFAVLNDLSAHSNQYRYAFKKAEKERNDDVDTEVEVKVYISCSVKYNLDVSIFSQLHEKSFGAERQYAVGTISIGNLTQSKWWKHDDASIILC